MRLSRRIAVAVASYLVLVLVAAGPTQAVDRKITLGISVLDDRSLAAVDAHKTSVGTYPRIWAVWSDWGGPDKDFPTEFMNGLKARGIVPMVNWQPTAPGSSDCLNWSHDAILSGKYDAYIRSWATAAKQYGGTVILRFAHEMNGHWFIWGHSRCQNTPAKFKAVWKRVWNIFRGSGGVGATNVKFMYSVLGASYVKAHYPGKAYVHYLGLTAFNWGPPRSWLTMVGTFKPTMRALLKLRGARPIIAAEMGGAYAPNCSTCNKAAYIAQGYPAIYAKWPRVVGMVYFDIDMTALTNGNQPNWRLDSPSSALLEYKKIAADPRFQGAIP